MSDKFNGLKLTWEEVPMGVSCEIFRILGRNLNCAAHADDYDYWGVRIEDERIPLSELFRLMESVDAGERVRKESLPESTCKSASSGELGMGMSDLLLRRHYECSWETVHIDEQNLWLLGVREDNSDEK